jgi:hypothetical protein
MHRNWWRRTRYLCCNHVTCDLVLWISVAGSE